jgi:hypothetical protein
MFRQFVNERTTNRYLPLIQKFVNKMLLHFLEDPERFLRYVSLLVRCLFYFVLS